MKKFLDYFGSAIATAIDLALIVSVLLGIMALAFGIFALVEIVVSLWR